MPPGTSLGLQEPPDAFRNLPMPPGTSLGGTGADWTGLGAEPPSGLLPIASTCRTNRRSLFLELGLLVRRRGQGLGGPPELLVLLASFSNRTEPEAVSIWTGSGLISDRSGFVGPAGGARVWGEGLPWQQFGADVGSVVSIKFIVNTLVASL